MPWLMESCPYFWSNPPLWVRVGGVGEVARDEGALALAGPELYVNCTGASFEPGLGFSWIVHNVSC